MRIPSHHNRRTSLDTETMTPMIDVVFLLLVFFVCASIGQKPEALLPAPLQDGATKSDVDVTPLPENAWQTPRVHIRLTQPPAGFRIQLNDQPVAEAKELRTRLTTLALAAPDSQIILEVADDVSVQRFISVYDLCQSLQFESVSLAVGG